MAKMAQAHQLPACTLPTLASDERRPAQQALNVPNRVYLGDGWHSTCRGRPRVPHPAKQSQLQTVPSLVYALSFSIGIPASTAAVSAKFSIVSIASFVIAVKSL